MTGGFYRHPRVHSASPMSVVQANRIIMHPHITERTFELASNESRICLIAVSYTHLTLPTTPYV